MEIITPPAFGAFSKDKYAAINDCVQLDVYSSTDLFLETIPRALDYSINNGTLSIDLEKELTQANYLAGDFRVTARLVRNVLGSLDGLKVIVQEISENRQEVRVQIVTPLDTGTSDAKTSQKITQDFINWFGTDLFTYSKQSLLANLYLYDTATSRVGVFDYIQDKITVIADPWSIIFKLTSPLTTDVTIGTNVWFSQDLANVITEDVRIVPSGIGFGYQKIKGPNYDALTEFNQTKATEYKDWDDLLGTTNQNAIISSVFSGSLVEGIDLNVDYRKFENFVFYGSAYERIKNFEYKVQMLEYYDSILANLTTGVSKTSPIFTSQSAAYQQKKQALIGTFDSFERYMYNESSSYVSNSFGQFLDIAWPKTGSLTPYKFGYTRKLAKPYRLQPSTSSYTQNWLNGLLQSASIYDQNNTNALVKLIPAHIRESDGNTSAETYVQLIGHYFDTVRSYVSQMTKVQDRNESLTEGFAKDLVYYIGQNLNIDYDNGSSLKDLWSYTLGLDATGSYTGSTAFKSYGTAVQTTAEDYTKEIWKRVINNLPYLLKTKGTERGVRALINCFGIPRTILRIREYGGPEPEFDTTSKANFERFSYALTVGTSQSYASFYNSSTYGDDSYGTRSGTSFLYTNWPTESRAIELRFKPDSGSKSSSQKILLEIPSKFVVYVGNSTSATTVGWYVSASTGNFTQGSSVDISSSLYDGDWNHIALVMSRSAVSTVDYNFYVSKVKYDKVITVSSSFRTTNNIYTGSLFGPIDPAKPSTTIYLPGSASISSSLAGGTHRSGLFSGSVQEFRIWTGSLGLDAIQQHALAPTSIVYSTASGFAGSTGSYNNLLLRLTLGSDTQRRQVGGTTTIGGTKYALQTLASQQPNQSIYKSASFANFGSKTFEYKPVVDVVNLAWPDFGANRQIGNKVRIDNTTTIGSQLYKNSRAQKSLYDLYPTDSPRLGVYLSPTDEVNQDIAEYYGGLSIDDYIGDPTDLYETSYKGLDLLKGEYIKKQLTTLYIASGTGSLAKNNTQYYINLLKYYDNSLFKLIKTFVPEKANLQVGLVLESDVLSRNKFPITKPNIPEDLDYDTTLLVQRSITPGGAIQDGDGGLVHQANYVQDGVIQAPHADPSAVCFEEIDTTLNGSKALTLSMYQNQYNNEQIPEQIADPTLGSLYGDVNLGISGTGRDLKGYGSQYRFLTWNKTGSGDYDFALVDSIGEDYWNPIQPIISSSRLSEQSIVNLFPYNGDDMLLGSGSFTNYSNVYYTGSNIISLENDFGFRFTPRPITSTTTDFWYSTTGTTGISLYYKTLATTTGTITIPIPADADKCTIYLKAQLTVPSSAGGTNTSNLTITVGSISRTYTISNQGITTIEHTTAVSNNSYAVLTFGPGAATRTLEITQLKITPLKSAQLQDYHVGDSASIGMKNVRYDGSKLTSIDYNIDSNDTVDKGPVITVLQSDPKDLVVKSSVRGRRSQMQQSTIGGTFEIS